MMQVVSVNVAKPIEVTHNGKTVRTGIFKTPVQGTVAVARHNLAGDAQADLENHGGEGKAVYAYALEHYAYWQQTLKREAMPYGQFGENLTIAGLDEAESYIGDYLKIGTAVFAITQPRVPCFKLGIKFGDPEMPKLFSKAARTGYYLKINSEGALAAGETVQILQRGAGNVSIKELFLAFFTPKSPPARAILLKALAVPELSNEWRTHIEERLR